LVSILLLEGGFGLQLNNSLGSCFDGLLECLDCDISIIEFLLGEILLSSLYLFNEVINLLLEGNSFSSSRYEFWSSSLQVVELVIHLLNSLSSISQVVLQFVGCGLGGSKIRSSLFGLLSEVVNVEDIIEFLG
jgi:hypothetical protein